MQRSDIPQGLARARAADLAKIPLATMKTISSPDELGMRLNAHDALVRKARAPHLEPDLVRGYHQLAREVLDTEDRARAVELMKSAGVAPRYSPPEMQRMLRAGTACRLGNGHICPVGNAGDLRYQVTIAQGAVGRGTPEDSSAFRAFLASRARSLGMPSLIPVRWGQPDARSSAVAAGKSAAGPRRPAAPRPAASGALAKAERYEEKARRVSDPGDRQAYLELAQAAREQAREQGDARAAKAAELTSWAAQRDLYGSLAKAFEPDRAGFPTLLLRGLG